MAHEYQALIVVGLIAYGQFLGLNIGGPVYTFETFLKETDRRLRI